MLIRDDYLKLIDEIRNLEKGALDGYIENKLIPLRDENEFFIETLYKDIYYVLQGVDEPGDNDLVIENGDFAFEDGDFKLSGYQTNLHRMEIWLHMQITEKTITNDFERLKTTKNFENFEWLQGIKNFEKNVLTKDTYTVEYRKKLDEINRSIRKERSENYKKVTGYKRFFGKIFDFDSWNLKLKIPIFGVEFNLGDTIKNIKSKNKTSNTK